MRLNKDTLARLVSLSDEELWREIQKMAGGFGLTLPKDTPSHAEMQRLRDAVNGGKINMSDAVRIVNSYKKGGQK